MRSFFQAPIAEEYTRDFQDSLSNYLSSDCFKLGNTVGISPWRRPIPQELLEKIATIDWSVPLPAGDAHSTKAALVHHALFNIYEQGLLFLPHEAEPGIPDDFHLFYCEKLVSLGESLRRGLEWIAFNALGGIIEVTGPWTLGTFREYTASILKAHDATPSSVCAAIAGATDPKAAFRHVLKQSCPDALSEASGMSRMLGGSFGRAQSELTKVFIDEFGYGIHEDKHSSLFEKLLSSLGLSHKAHAYYSEYTIASLLAANYFHYISLNKRHWAKYVGAIYFAEASLPHVNRQMAQLAKEIVPEADLTYFTEHVEIDSFHKEMVVDRVIAPVSKVMGGEAIKEMVRGFEEFRSVLSTLGEGIKARVSSMSEGVRSESESANSVKHPRTPSLADRVRRADSVLRSVPQGCGSALC